MDGEVTIRRLFRSCRQTASHRSATAAASSGWPFPWARDKRRRESREGTRTSEQFDAVSVQHYRGEGGNTIEGVQYSKHQNSGVIIFSSLCLLGTNTPATTELRRLSRSPQRTRNPHTPATLEYRRCTAGRQQGSRPTWSTYLFNPFTLSTCAEL